MNIYSWTIFNTFLNKSCKRNKKPLHIRKCFPVYCRIPFAYRNIIRLKRIPWGLAYLTRLPLNGIRRIRDYSNSRKRRTPLKSRIWTVSWHDKRNGKCQMISNKKERILCPLMTNLFCAHRFLDVWKGLCSRSSVTSAVHMSGTQITYLLHVL